MSLPCAQETRCCSLVTCAHTVFWYDLCLLQHTGLADLGRNRPAEKEAALSHLPWMPLVSLVWLSWWEQQGVSDRWGRGMLYWRNRCSPSCLGSSRVHSDFLCLSLTVCCVFLLQTIFVVVLRTYTWRGNHWELYADCIKCFKLANTFGILSPECLHFGTHN